MQTVTNIQPKARKVRGEIYQHVDSNTYNADIECGKSIRIYGTYRNGKTQQFDRVFKIGDEVEYDSYNLHYTGKIIAIGNKTVTVDTQRTYSPTKRLDLHTFCWRNWDFDAAETARYNAEEMLCI